MQALAPLLVLTLTLGLSQGQMDIPARELGFVYNNGKPCATIKLAAYMDLTCPNSQMAYPTLLKVADHFGGQDVQLKIYLFSLPYHRNSHVISKAARVLDAFKSPKNATVYDWFTLIYANLDRLSTSATAEMNDVQVEEFLASLAENLAGISPVDFKEGVSNIDIDLATRLEWKYGCTRGVYGTPMFTLNDVFFGAEATWTVEQWVDVIKKLLGKQQTGNNSRQC